MNPCAVSITLLFFCFTKILTAATDNPTDVSINCGSSITYAARNDLAWHGDIHQKSSSLLQIKGSSTTSALNHISADPIPYKTARISRTQFSYEFFKLNPGQKIIRFHLNPAPYKGFKRFEDLFTVEAGPFTLLSNFSASLTADALRTDSFTKEFWRASVDVGFRYLVRLHFSKLGFKMAETAGVMFRVYINEMIANTNNIGTFRERGEDNSIPWFRDYIVMIKGHRKEGKRDLLICLQTNDEFNDGYGPLKGFEIMKLSNLENSLASPNPLASTRDSLHGTIQNLLRDLDHRNAVASVVITILAVANILIHTLVQIREASCMEEENKPSARAERLCRRFPLAELQLATRDFSDAHLIGRGGFGKVYKGVIDNRQETVAIKRLKSNSKQGAREFLTEIETLTELRHVNLVSLIGYCNDHGEMILVYEYMASGTLADHLYKLARNNDNIPSLTWKQRLHICIGVGRGLDYLHTGHSIIHRDVKASNILLDENFIAKFSDFGLAKHEDRSKSQSHVSTNVKGTLGYFDPYYFTTRKLTTKSDTYAFGVVLLEVLCGRPALDTRVAEDEQILTKWARDNISKGNIDQIVASTLRGEISEDSLKAFAEVAEKCLHDEPKKRPTMAQVVLQLEFALEQQEIIKPPVPNGIPSDVDDNIHPCNDQETNLSAGTGEPTMPSTNVENLAPTPKEQTKNRVVSAEPFNDYEYFS